MSNNFNKMLNKTLELVAIDSVQAMESSKSPFGDGVGLCIEKVIETAKAMGFTTHNEAGYYGTACIGEGEEFGILGHVDVVPYNKAEWEYNPLGEIKNGVIYGRGVLDDKGPFLCCLYAVNKLIEEGYKPKKKIKFIFGGNEESGWKCIERYNQVDVMPYTGISPDADFPVINCEKGIAHLKVTIPTPKNLIRIKGGTRPNIVINECEAIVEGLYKPTLDVNVRIENTDSLTYIKAVGTAAHGSTPEKGDNAFNHVIKYLSNQCGGVYTELESLLCHTDGSGLGIKMSDEKSGALSFNTGIVANDDEGLELTFDIRYPISASIDKIINSISEKFNTKPTILSIQRPLFVEKDDPLVLALLDSYNEVMNQKAYPISIGGGTYARALKHGVGFGPVFPNQESTAHEKDEHVSITDFENAYKIYYEAIKKLCF